MNGWCLPKVEPHRGLFFKGRLRKKFYNLGHGISDEIVGIIDNFGCLEIREMASVCLSVSPSVQNNTGRITSLSHYRLKDLLKQEITIGN